jgi:hypothetical protein
MHLRLTRMFGVRLILHYTDVGNRRIGCRYLVVTEGRISGDTMPISGRVASALPGMKGPRQSGSGLAEAGSCGVGPLSSKSDETERTSDSSASSIGRGRILTGSLVATPASWEENRPSVVLRISTQIVLSEVGDVAGSRQYRRKEEARQDVAKPPLWMATLGEPFQR